MLYVFNGKSFNSEIKLSEEISLFVKSRLKVYNLTLKGDNETLNDLFNKFTHHFLKSPKLPNLIKHRNEASNLTICLNGKYFRGFLSEVNIFNNSEPVSVVCYTDQELNNFTIEVKHMLIKLCLTSDQLSLSLIEI